MLHIGRGSYSHEDGCRFKSHHCHRYPVKTSQNQNIPSDLPKSPIFGESKRPKYIFTLFNQTRDSKQFFVNTLVEMFQSQIVPSQNVPKSKRTKSKRTRVKMSQSQNVPSQNVPSQNVPSQNSQSQNVPSQNVLSCLSACKQHYSHSNEVLY